MWVDLHLTIAPGWHTYWRNPGDSGLPTEIAWKLPPGFTAGPISWPVPERFVVGDVGNYGYAGSADLLVPITTPADLKSGDTAHLAATASWLVCSEICIPGSADLTLDLPATAAPAAPDPTTAARFAAIRNALPQKAAFTAGFAAAGGNLGLSIPASAAAGIAQPALAFFPSDSNVVDAAVTPQQNRTSDGYALLLKRATGPTAHTPKTLDGVLVVRGDAGTQRAYTLAATSTTPATDDSAGLPWWQALLLAFLGGAILNLMPCVFPILSLKLLGFTDAFHRAEERRHAAAYTAGVVLSFAALGGALLLFRASGGAVGWGFQLQSPVVVALLAYLLFALGLSLSGVADFGISFSGVGGRLADRAGLFGAAATGVLAAIVAAPCTAPFMGAAVGFALIAPAPLALLIFVMLGIGMAAPVVLAAAVPGIARLLPRPGAWMVWFKQLLAFPMYATVTWLIWVLLQEVAPASAFLALVGLVAVGFATWVYGRTRALRPRARRTGGGFAAISTAAAIVLATTLVPASERPAAATSGNLAYEPFTPARLAGLEEQHRPVFVNLTAAWCITCLVNERAALDSDAVRRAFTARHIAALKGDWTRQDPAITTFLLQFGRSGVPLYLLYDSAGNPTVLPQILTEAKILAAIGKI